MPTKFYSLRSVRGKDDYLCLGNAKIFADKLVFGSKFVRLAKTLFLKAQIASPFKSNISSKWASITTTLVRMEHIRDVLLLDTGLYKTTKAVGFVRTAHQDLFVKFYALPEECLFEERQAHFAREMFSGMFVIAPVMDRAHNALFFQSLDSIGSFVNMDEIESRLLHLIQKFINAQSVEKTIGDSVPLDFSVLCQNTEYHTLATFVRTWVNQNRDQTIWNIPIHGDLTPWNMFVTKDDKIALVDYERAGWHVPFYDLFHLTLQSEALNGNKFALQTKLYKKPWFDKKAMHVYLRLYLIDQIYHDLDDHLNKGFDHIQLKNALSCKKLWLEKLLNEEHG